MDESHQQSYLFKLIGHTTKIIPPIEDKASGGSISPPLEVAGYVPILIDGVKYKIPIYYD